MPDPELDPNFKSIQKAATIALVAGAALMLLKLTIFWLTNSVAVLTDALESVINIVAATIMLYTIWYSNRPADREHPYGHGKIEFLAVGLEGWLILMAAVVIAVEAIQRLIAGEAPQRLGVGIGLLGAVGVLDAILAAYVWRAGRRYNSAPLVADGKHLVTDVASTAGVIVGLLIVQWTGKAWVDPIVAMIMASLILYASWRLLWQSFHGLMDHSDPEDQKAINDILRDEMTAGHIRGYHKVRHRHAGSFHWVEMHLEVDPNLSIREGHLLASRIEHRIEKHLGQANATAHIEPFGDPPPR